MTPIRTVIKRISVVDFLNLVFLFILTIFLVSVYKYSPYLLSGLSIYIVMFLFIFYMSWVRDTKPDFNGKSALMFAYPVLFFFIVFERILILYSEETPSTRIRISITPNPNIKRVPIFELPNTIIFPHYTTIIIRNLCEIRSYHLT